MLNEEARGRMGMLALMGAFFPFFAIIWMTMLETGGIWEYPLDDPYIHLAMSEQIAAGGYGVNAGEYASASSSILFPYLLAPFASLPWHWLMPLALGGLGLLAGALIWARVLRGAVETAPPGAAIYLLVLAFIGPLFLHLVGVSLIGMEHGLHVLAAMMVALGLIRFAETGRVHWYLALGIILCPLIRFEGLAMAGAACAILFLSGKRSAALAIGAATAAPLLAYVAYMNAIGLSPLPNSIMAKAAVVGGDTHFVTGQEETRWETMLSTIGYSFQSSSGFPLLALSLFWLAGAAIWRKHLGMLRVLIALSVPAIAMAHVLLGSIGFFYRYEVYAWAYGIVISVYLLSVIWAHSDLAARLAPALIVLVLVAGAKHYPLQAFFIYPDAGAAIAVQQKQMGRFVDDYLKGPVAVNDLGHVAYRNEHYVLDLWGLASFEALQARMNWESPDWADTLIARYRPEAIMIYESWFQGRTGPEWVKLAEMRMARPLGALGGSVVAFYAPSAETEAPLRARLEAFAPSLPDGAAFEFVN